jgi:hypothetical protein
LRHGDKKHESKNHAIMSRHDTPGELKSLVGKKSVTPRLHTRRSFALFLGTWDA